MGDAGLGSISARIARPAIQVRIKVDDRDGSIYLIQGPQDREHNCVISTKAAGKFRTAHLDAVTAKIQERTSPPEGARHRRGQDFAIADGW